MAETMHRCRKYSSRTNRGTASRAATASAPAMALRLDSATLEEPVGPEKQQQDDGEKTDGVFPARGHVARAEAFCQSEEEAADDGADETAHSAKDHHDEG